MSRDKFIDILRFIRFDKKKNERSKRLKTDKFALISKIWETFIENSQACYKPDANITIDEQLFPTKARRQFTQYITTISTKRTNITIEKNKKLVPETVTYYNSTKYGVDVLDQMARKYSVKASSRRWPLQVFHNIFDLTAINAWILYKETTRVNISRKDFIFQLAEELRTKYREEVENTSIPMTEIHATDARKNCQVQRSCKRNRCTNHCAKCNRNVRGKCVSKTEFICEKCFP
ncbi:hypothetical protein WN51_12562 [Melipona quadrifasciata]|uniref:PiggyBac transposable element-derived protein domain-containing protein n=1 Tax=Melipona quadrifasciata TaxID=166423 RepID=A0A0N0U5S1_9HYME|nr:hypothetical protein WN51_12562 [Melipona quadrifasciata]